jgi:hypothetical protein
MKYQMLHYVKIIDDGSDNEATFTCGATRLNFENVWILLITCFVVISGYRVKH